MTGQAQGSRDAAWLAAAVGLGCLHLVAAGAPAMFVAVQGGAAIIGLGIGIALRGPRRSSVAAAAAGAAIVATALFGVRVDGIARWVAAGPVRLQPALMLVPPLVVALAIRRDAATATGVALAGTGLSLQPDRGTAGALALALLTLAATRRTPLLVALALLAAGCFGWTMVQPDPLPPARFVEGVYAAAAGDRARIALLAAGTAAMLAPGLWRLASKGRADSGGMAFVAIWAGLLGAAWLGAYPTPVLGYGASGVIGYALGLLALRR